MNGNNKLGTSFYFYLASEIFSAFGDAIGKIAVSWFVYELTGSYVALGTIALVAAIPEIFILIFGGPLIDKFNKKQLLILIDSLRCLLYLLMPFMSLLGVLEVYHIYIIMTLIASIGALSLPTHVAMLAEIVPDQMLLKANSWQSFSLRGIKVIGAGIAGMIVTFAGAEIGLIIDALTFGISALLLPFVQIENNEKTQRSKRKYLSEVTGAFKYFTVNPMLARG